MKYVVAVSGGVDSVVLLDMLVHFWNSTAEDTSATRELQGEERFLELISKNPAEGQTPPFIVAHFDHGIRPESAGDMLFVKTLAEKHGLLFETEREELGMGASEEKARERRYAFLRKVAKKYGARIVTAHHLDDLVETIAINLVRGTGWRGLAVLDSPDIERPLLGFTKQEVMTYAKEKNLAWREDVTNQDTKYLRNTIRQKLAGLDEQTKVLLKLYRDRQVFLRKEGDTEADRLIGASPYRRFLFIATPSDSAMELLRAVFIHQCGYGPTRPQLDRALMAIKTAGPSQYHSVMANVGLRFTRTHFVVEHL